MAGSDAPEDGDNSVHPENSSTEGPQLSLSSDEVNYLVFRYLQECGFVHSAFSFAHESMLGSTGLRSADRTLPPGALVTFLQKGLQYVGMEERLRLEELKEGRKQTSANKKKESTSNIDISDFSLLSHSAISAIARRDPPLQLNVPPAVAAAAVKARLEAEAKVNALEAEAKVNAQRDPIQTNKASENGKLTKELAPQEPYNKPDPAPAPSVLPNAQSAVPLPIQLQNDSVVARQQAIAAQALQIQQQQLASDQITSVAPTTSLAKADSKAVTRNATADLLNSQHGAQNLVASADVSTLAEAAALASQKLQHQKDPSGQLLGTGPQPSSKRSSGGASGGSKRSNKRQKIQTALVESRQTVGSYAATQETIESRKGRGGNNQNPQISASAPSVEVEPQRKQQQQIDFQKNTSQHAGLVEQQDFRYIQHGQEHSLNGQSSSPGFGAAVAGGGGKGKPGVTDRNPHLSSNKVIGSRTDSIESYSQQDSANVDATDLITDTPQDHILKLEMHESEVFMCAWNPVYTDLIATGSGDASARIWQVGGTKAAAGLTTVKLLPHGLDPRDRKNKDVTTLEWSSDGTLLATGSYDGVARVWARNGALIHTLKGHTGPIFSLKWNKQGNYLLSGSYDKTTIVWDVSGSAGFVEQQFTEHQAPALDVDWKDNTTFASCSTDKTVHICRVGVSRPLKVYVGHSDEVNAVKWDPSGRLLASCSDDCTAKIWDVESDRSDPLYDLKSHEQEIYTVKWSPTGPGSRHPNKKSILATASFDGSVRLWNVVDGSCYRVFNRHKDSVYSVAFSPSGDFLASGSLAGQMYVWDIEQSKHIKSYKGKGDIFEVAWNKEETRVAACFSSNMVAIIDFNRPLS